MTITLDETVKRIVERSSGAYWSDRSEGLALVLTPDGFSITAMPQVYRGADVLPERVIILRDDGRPMPHGHILTPQQRERAVRAILEKARRGTR
jgi:hypothetical protein